MRKMMRTALGLCFVLAGGVAAEESYAADSTAPPGSATTNVPMGVDPSVSGKALQPSESVGDLSVSSDQGGGAITSGSCMKGNKATGATKQAQCKKDGGVWHATTLKQKPVTTPETQTSGGVTKPVAP